MFADRSEILEPCSQLAEPAVAHVWPRAESAVLATAQPSRIGHLGWVEARPQISLLKGLWDQKLNLGRF